MAEALDAFAAESDRPLDAHSLEAAVAEGLARPHDLSPWATWLLLCLIRYRRRLDWAADVVRNRMPFEEVSIDGFLQDERSGAVPGEPEWRYRLAHGVCQLTHDATGEWFPCVAHDAFPGCLDLRSFVRYVGLLRDPSYPERRLLELHRNIESAFISQRELLEAGLLKSEFGQVQVRLHPDTRRLVPRVESPVWPVSSGTQVFLAAMLGDWQGVETAFAACEHIRDVRSVADEQRRARERRLKASFEIPHLKSYALLGFDDLRSPLLDAHLARAFDGDVHAAAAAFKIVAAYDDSAWCEPVYRFFEAARPDSFQKREHTGLALAMAEYLLRRGYRTADVADWLSTCRFVRNGETALLALELAPQTARALFRETLISHVADYRIFAAAALAILDEPWCHDVLTTLIKRYGGEKETDACRAALRASSSLKMRELEMRWQRINVEPPADDAARAAAAAKIDAIDAALRRKIDELRVRIAPLAGRNPPPEPVIPLRPGRR